MALIRDDWLWWNLLDARRKQLEAGIAQTQYRIPLLWAQTWDTRWQLADAYERARALLDRVATSDRMYHAALVRDQ